MVKEMANQPEATIRMDIEKDLQADRSGKYKSSISAGIADQLAAVEAAMKKGATTEEYRRLTTLKTGLAAASMILDRTWLYYHS